MASAVLIWLCVVLGAGFALLLSCRAILQFGTTGRAPLAEAGFRQAVNTSPLSSSARRWVAYAAFCERTGMPETLTPPALSPGLQTGKKQHKPRGPRSARARIEFVNSDDLPPGSFPDEWRYFS